MKKMKHLFFILLFVIFGGLAGLPLQAKDKPFQLIHGLLYRMERVDSCMVLDMNLDLRGVRLAPDCTVYLIPRIFSTGDSLDLPPVMLNGPQSDLMYRRRKALGRFIEPTAYEPHAVLREGDHELPVINYRKDDIAWLPWMDKADIMVLYKSYNADARLIPIKAEFERIPPVIVEKIITDTIIIHDTLRIEKKVDRPVYVQAAAPSPEKKKEAVIEHAGYTADIYFPTGVMKILPEHDLNKEAWHAFVSEIESIHIKAQNTVIGINITGYSSPEGNYKSNERLAERRAAALKSFLETKYNTVLVEMNTSWVAEDWDKLVEMLKQSDVLWKDQVIGIIENTEIFDGRESKLKTLDGGRIWQYMEKNMFPKLRRVSCRIGYLKKINK